MAMAPEQTGIGIRRQYGFRCHGPWRPWEGHRYNPDKLLLDPYARGLARTSSGEWRSYVQEPDTFDWGTSKKPRIGMDHAACRLHREMKLRRTCLAEQQVARHCRTLHDGQTARLDFSGNPLRIATADVRLPDADASSFNPSGGIRSRLGGRAPGPSTRRTLCPLHLHRCP